MDERTRFWLGFWMLVLVVNMVGFVVNDQVNKWAATSEMATEVVLGFHLASFMTSGGGPLGPETNYFAWSYTKALEKPRPWWSHVLFSEILTYQLFGYWVHPAEEWPYPGLEPKTSS